MTVAHGPLANRRAEVVGLSARRRAALSLSREGSSRGQPCRIPLDLEAASARGTIHEMLALRFGFTIAVMPLVIWLLSTGRPLAGLLIVPIIAVWVRHAAESGRLLQLAKRGVRPS